MDIGEAIAALKRGRRVARAGWNGAGQWLAYSPGFVQLPAERFFAPPNKAYAEANGGVADIADCITLKNAQGAIVMGWTPSTGDLLADDWDVVE